MIGDLDPLRTPIHVYDDTSLDIVLRMLDTTPDFLEYINAKERLFRSRAAVHAAGEEEVLG
ncbi:MAG: hypothetical protein ACRD2A_16750, partial [Vicinamibacterales bacterium]